MAGAADILYRQLEPRSIRLLQIRGSAPDELKCTLDIFASEQTPEYSAVSYTWSPAEDPRYSTRLKKATDGTN